MGCFLTVFLSFVGVSILLGAFGLIALKLYLEGVVLLALAFVVFYLAFRLRKKYKSFDYSNFARDGIAISFLHIKKDLYDDYFNIKYLDGPQVGKEIIYATNTIKSSTHILFPGVHTAEVSYSITYKELYLPSATKILCQETIKFETKANMYYLLTYDKENNKFVFEEKPEAEELEKLLKEQKLKI